MTAKHIRTSGKIALFAGLLTAGTIYVTAGSDERAKIIGIDTPTKRDRLQLERMGGKNYVVFKELDDWFFSLWHGRRLGYTIGVMSIMAFLLCRGIAYVHEQEERAKAKTADKAPEPSRRG